MSTATVELPNDKIIVRGGQVARIEDYMNWNGEPFCSTMIERVPDGIFRSAIGDPSAGVFKSGDLQTVLSPLHQKFQAAFTKLFSLQNPTEAELWEAALAAGFRKQRCEIVRH